MPAIHLALQAPDAADQSAINPAVPCSTRSTAATIFVALARTLSKADGGGSGWSGSAIAGIVIAILLLATMGGLFSHWFRRRNRHSSKYDQSYNAAYAQSYPYDTAKGYYASPKQETMYLPRYNGQTYPQQTGYAPYGGGGAQLYSPPPVVYPIHSQNTYYAPAHQQYQPQGVRFGEVAVRRI